MTKEEERRGRGKDGKKVGRRERWKEKSRRKRGEGEEAKGRRRIRGGEEGRKVIGEKCRRGRREKGRRKGILGKVYRIRID